MVSRFRLVRWIALLSVPALLSLAGCEDSCESLREEACVVQETGAAECSREEGKSGAVGPREALCERALILYRSQVQN